MPDDPGSPPPRRPRGRPKGKPLSAAELAQRQGAAWKHGGRAATPLRRIVHPCRSDLCPMSEENGGEGYPCSAKREVDRAGGGLTACLPDLLAFPDIADRYRRALESGDLGPLQEMTANALGGMTVLHGRELRLLLETGLAIEQEMVSKEGDIIGTKVVANPAAEPFLKLSEQLGFTAPAQRLTPKSQGDGKLGDGVADLIGFMARSRDALESGERR